MPHTQEIFVDKVYPKGTLILFTPVHRTTIDMIESWLGVVNGVVEPTFNPKKGWKFKDRFIQS